MDKPFSIGEILEDAWLIAKKNIWIVIGFTALIFTLMFIINTIIAGFFGPEETQQAASKLISNLILSLVDAFTTVAMYQVFFKLIDEDTNPQFPDFIPNLLKAFNFIAVKIMMGLVAVFLIAVFASLYISIVPGINLVEGFSWKMFPLFILIAIPILYFSIRLNFVVCFIVDQDSGPAESISQSWAITKGHFWFLFGLFIVILLINVLGAMAFLVGLLFTVPFSSLILMITYRQMINSYTDEEEVWVENKAGSSE